MFLAEGLRGCGTEGEERSVRECLWDVFTQSGGADMSPSHRKVGPVSSLVVLYERSKGGYCGVVVVGVSL